MPDEMNIFQQDKPEGNKPRPKTPRGAVMWGVVLALAAGNTAAIWRINDAQDQMDKMAQANQTLQAAVVTLRDTAHDLAVRADTNEALIRGEMQKTRKVAKKESYRATKLAEKKAVAAARKIEVAYRRQHEQLEGELGGVRQDARQTSGQISAMIEDVDVVRGDLAETQTGLDRTRTELGGVKGDLGVQSGLIATNAKELNALRQLGERHYYEFNLPKNGRAYKVSRDVVLKLRKTKPKRGRYTLDVIADDRQVEKKDRTINEPVQFYVSGSRQPYELVVNKIEKGRVTGYLAAPKVFRARLQAN